MPRRPKRTIGFSAAALTLVAAIAPLAPARAQQNLVVRNLMVSAHVTDLSIINGIAALALYDSTPTGDLKLAGTVNTTHNGPYALQVKISSEAFKDTLLARTPNTTYVMVTTSSWLTIATGPGGTDKTNHVDYWIKLGKSSSLTPATAEGIPVTYRVVANQ
jgi:hypothetical protein